MASMRSFFRFGQRDVVHRRWVAAGGDIRTYLSLTGWLGRGLGWGSVLAEKFVFDALPVQLRSHLINAYRRSSGRV